MPLPLKQVASAALMLKPEKTTLEFAEVGDVGRVVDLAKELSAKDDRGRGGATEIVYDATAAYEIAERCRLAHNREVQLRDLALENEATESTGQPNAANAASAASAANAAAPSTEPLGGTNTSKGTIRQFYGTPCWKAYPGEHPQDARSDAHVAGRILMSLGAAAGAISEMSKASSNEDGGKSGDDGFLNPVFAGLVCGRKPLVTSGFAPEMDFVFDGEDRSWAPEATREKEHAWLLAAFRDRVSEFCAAEAEKPRKEAPGTPEGEQKKKRRLSVDSLEEFAVGEHSPRLCDLPVVEEADPAGEMGVRKWLEKVSEQFPALKAANDELAGSCGPGSRSGCRARGRYIAALFWCFDFEDFVLGRRAMSGQYFLRILLQ